jgi:WD40 repeat protein
VWDLESNALIATIESGHSQELWSCDVFGDGTPRVLTGGGDHTLKIWG